MPPQDNDDKPAPAHATDTNNHPLLPPKPLLFSTHRCLNQIIITSHPQFSPSYRPRPGRTRQTPVTTLARFRPL